MKTCCIYYWDNGSGVGIDAELIHQCLNEEFECLVLDFSIDENQNQDLFDIQSTEKNDIGIFIQNYDNNLLHRNRINVYIVNEEWLSVSEINSFSDFDYIITKSDYGKKLLFDLHKNINTLYFWSRDLYNERFYNEQDDSILHLAGCSIQKNTEILLNEPSIHIFDRTARFKDVREENYYTKYISENKLNRLLSICNTHVCPSLYEAHGHYMYEGLLCDKNVIASNISPWNEQIDPDYINFVDIDNVIINSDDYDFLSGKSVDNTIHPLRRGFLVNRDELEEKIKNPTNKKPRKYIIDLFEKNKKQFLNFFTSL